jgi:putative hydrolase of the HAD superfamily
VPREAASRRPEIVFLDVGGVLYDDGVYRRALRRALRELGADVTDEAFDAAYERCRRAQDGSFRAALTRAFLGDAASSDVVAERASRYWAYPPDALEPDVRACLHALSGRYRLGVVANQPSVVRAAMRRDGIDGYFDVWGISDDVGIDKPDPRLYEHVLALAGVDGPRAVMVGDRLDYDVRPARRAGMRAVWLLRGEAPARPTQAQLAETDASIASLDELPAVLLEL